jgi:sugar phosphate isomerase/epimerase
MHIGFSTGTFYHRSAAYSLRLAREAGYDGVELVLGPEQLLRGLGSTLRAMCEVGVPVRSVHPPFAPLPGWPRAYAEVFPRLASITMSLGAELFVSHTPFLSSPESPRGQRFTRGLRLGLEAGGDAIQIGLESSQYNKRSRRYLLDDLATLTRFAQERGCGVTFDTCHAGANGEDILACYEIVRPALRNVHLSDVIWREGKPRTHVLPGEGVLPLAAFLARLAHDGYDGLVTLEIHPGELGLFGRERQAQRLRQALDFVRAALTQPVRPTEGKAG